MRRIGYYYEKVFNSALVRAGQDVEIARNYLIDEIYEYTEIVPLYDLYISNLKIQQLESSEDCRFVDWVDESVLDTIISKNVFEVGFERSDAARHIGKLRHGFVDAIKRARMLDKDDFVAEAVGEFARQWFRLCSIITAEYLSTEEVMDRLLGKMNSLNIDFLFDSKDARDAVLARNVFIPIDKCRAEERFINLIGAEALAESGNITGAADAAGIRRGSEDVVLENIRYIKEYLKQKIDNDDFEIAPKVELPDVGREVDEINNTMIEINNAVIKSEKMLYDLRKYKESIRSYATQEQLLQIEQMEARLISELDSAKAIIEKYKV